MRNHEFDSIQARVKTLERRQWFLGGALIIVVVLGLWSSFEVTAYGKSGILRVRGLIVEDEQGRDRVVLGAPVPDAKAGKRISPATGMVINDPEGHERFGLGLKEDGSMGMGFDAPPGLKLPNPERINIWADAKGGSTIRFLNRKSSLVGALRLDEKDRFVFEFVDVRPNEVVRRQLSFAGDETVKQPR